MAAKGKKNPHEKINEKIKLDILYKTCWKF
jgi:hypothetical protein